jgi:hypothetical protein
MTLRSAVQLYQQRGSVLVTAPATEPVTASELRSYLIVDSTQLPDADANALITDARTEIENQIGIAIISQSWRLSLDYWPGGQESWWDGVREGSINNIYVRGSQATVELPRWPITAITSVTVYDEDSNATTVTIADTFDLDTYRLPGRITLKRGATWPIALRSNNAIQIIYVAGYANAAAVPAPIKRAVKEMAAYLYAHRGDECDPTDAWMKSGAQSTLNVYKIARV